MAEPEFVLMDDAPTTSAAVPLKRAGKHQPASAVLVDLHAHPRAHRALMRCSLVAILALAIGAAVISFKKRRAQRADDIDEILER
jgi:hypothetical protein